MEDLQEIKQLLKENQIIMRVNNLLLSRFILKLDKTRIELGLPKRVFFYKYELLEDDFNELVQKYGKEDVVKALYRLDRMLLLNKQQCPNDIKKYISKRLEKSIKDKAYRDKYNDSKEIDNE